MESALSAIAMLQRRVVPRHPEKGGGTSFIIYTFNVFLSTIQHFADVEIPI
jgi:hypothetical protein